MKKLIVPFMLSIVWTPLSFADSKCSTTVYSGAAGLKLRKEPRKKAKVNSVLIYGTALCPTGKTIGSSVEVNVIGLPELTGWLPKNFVQKDQPTVEKAMKEAAKAEGEKNLPQFLVWAERAAELQVNATTLGNLIKAYQANGNTERAIQTKSALNENERPKLLHLPRVISYDQSAYLNRSQWQYLTCSESKCHVGDTTLNVRNWEETDRDGENVAWQELEAIGAEESVALFQSVGKIKTGPVVTYHSPTTEEAEEVSISKNEDEVRIKKVPGGDVSIITEIQFKKDVNEERNDFVADTSIEKIEPPDNLDVYGPEIYPQKPKADVLFYVRQGDKKQLLLKTELDQISGLAGIEKGGSLVRWVGDLDGDGKFDLILSVDNKSDDSVSYSLYLSSKAKEGDFVGEAGTFYHLPRHKEKEREKQLESEEYRC